MIDEAALTCAIGLRHDAPLRTTTQPALDRLISRGSMRHSIERARANRVGGTRVDNAISNARRARAARARPGRELGAVHADDGALLARRIAPRCLRVRRAVGARAVRAKPTVICFRPEWTPLCRCVS